MVDVLGYIPAFQKGVRDLIVPIQQNEFGIDITYDDQPDLKDIPGFYQNGIGNFWVAVDGLEVIGSIALKDIGGGEAALRKMFVAKSQRGADRGVAVELLQTLLGHARMVKLQAIYLGTTPQFKAAHRFYEKHGFQLIAPESLPVNFPRMVVDTRVYRLAM